MWESSLVNIFLEAMGSMFDNGFEMLDLKDGNQDGVVRGSELGELDNCNSNTCVDAGELNLGLAQQCLELRNCWIEH